MRTSGLPPPGGAKPADFLNIKRVKTVFPETFEKAWQDFPGKAIEGASPATGGAASTPPPGTGSLSQGPPPAPGAAKPDASTVREDARRHADEFLARPLWVEGARATGTEMLAAQRGNTGWAGLRAGCKRVVGGCRGQVQGLWTGSQLPGKHRL